MLIIRKRGSENSYALTTIYLFLLAEVGRLA
jgi:hypothetical protein